MTVLPVSVDGSYFPPHPEEQIPPAPSSECGALDGQSEARCNRARNHVDAIHWFEDEDWRIQWMEVPVLHL